MPKLTNYQRDAIAVLRARLDPSHPGFTAVAGVRAALEYEPGGLHDNAGLYIQSWVLPLLDLIENGPSFHGEERYVAQDAGRVVAAKRAADEAAAQARVRRLAEQHEAICSASASHDPADLPMSVGGAS